MARVREARAGDVEAIAEVYVASWRAAYRGVFPDEYLDGLSAEDRRAWWSDLLARSDPAFFALVVEEDEGTIVGFSLAGRARADEPDTAQVWQLYLDPAAWGRGLGRALFTETTRRLRRDGFHDAQLWVEVTNERARRFYEAAGWHEDGTTKTEEVWGVEATSTCYRTTLRPPDAG